MIPAILGTTNSQQGTVTTQYDAGCPLPRWRHGNNPVRAGVHRSIRRPQAGRLLRASRTLLLRGPHRARLVASRSNRSLDLLQGVAPKILILIN